MKTFYIITLLIISALLLAENFEQELISDSYVKMPPMDTRGIEPNLKLFLDKYYQKNYSGEKAIQSIKSIQFVGTYELNGKEIGTIKIIKKRPNKYKSHIKNNDNSEQIIIFNGKTLKKASRKDSEAKLLWKELDNNAPENFWIYFFDSLMLNPKNPNKEIYLHLPIMEEKKIIQPISIEFENKIKITNFIPIKDNLIKKTLIEFNSPGHPDYSISTIYFDNYEFINGVMYPKKIITMLNQNRTITYNFSDINFNLGITDFFFNGSSL